MENYIKENFEGKVKLVKLETRLGLIVARMKGAKKATSEVLVFLDSHIEVNVNWLPPLLGQLKLLNFRSNLMMMIFRADCDETTNLHYANHRPIQLADVGI